MNQVGKRRRKIIMDGWKFVNMSITLVNFCRYILSKVNHQSEKQRVKLHPTDSLTSCVILKTWSLKQHSIADRQH